MDADRALRFLPGIGPAKASALAALGLETLWDVLHHVPRCLGAAPPLCESGAPMDGEALRLRARVTAVKPVFRRGGGRGGMGVMATLERADGRAFTARFWNASWLRRHLLVNEWYLFEGTMAQGGLAHPSFVHLKGGPTTPLPEEVGCRVAYRLPEGFSERSFASLVDAGLDQATALEDPAGELAPAAYAALLRALHRPADAREHETARRALAARELLALALALQGRRARVVAAPGRAWACDDERFARALARLPFALTPGQRDALAELRADLQAPAPMYRLLQGDVGSGKTALALVAALMVVAERAQALLLAPTAVLARQHHAFCARCLAGSRVRIALLTGGTPAAERRTLIAELAAGRVDLLIGTHALLEEDVRAPALGLAIIDEQHKFGVEQRAALVGKGVPWAHGAQPDLLLMTATPIPRTLALTAFGDLAVSRIAGRPPGRGCVATQLRPWTTPRELAATVAECLAAGGRAFVICPLREESEKVAAADAATIAAGLTASLGGRVALLTGALAEAEKLAVLDRFQRGDATVLVSTTVVEVGIDVPEATLMAVIDAPRFGLAQLHQLRGRIGRGARDGRCVLYHRTAEDGERLRILATTDDGLAIAEADLAERGPGQLLGTEQHGLPRLRIADLARDLDLLQAAHQRARTLVAAGTRLPMLDRFLRGAADGPLAGSG
ncbi:MAG TPA: helicase-related protein [Planctomycetota bacterium]|nr:helicase-related protein [Planctomycetota bacterium]